MKLFQDLEERERNLYATQGRSEITLQSLHRDLKYHEDKHREYEKKICQLEHHMAEEIEMKDRARLNLHDFVRRLAHALNSEFCDSTHHSPELVIHKAEELVQEVNRLRTKTTTVESHLTSVEVEAKSIRDGLDRANIDRDQMQRQITTLNAELDRLRQVKVKENYGFRKFFVGP